MTVTAPAPPPDETVAGRSLWQDALRRLLRNRAAAASAVFIAVLVAACAVVPWCIDHKEQHTAAKFEPPGQSTKTGMLHVFGTDEYGRDLFARCFYGGRISLLIGIVATLIAILIGTLYGSIAGYAGGWVDNVMMRIVDILYGVPYMLIVLLIMVAIGKRGGLVPIFAALGLFQWLTTARIVRGQVLTYKGREFVLAARTIGAPRGRILVRHLLPNVMGPVIVYSTLMVPSVILQEAFLSYLGLGVQEPHTSWGLLASDGARAINPIRTYWWLLTFPALFLASTLLALNFLGDGLRDAFDPKGRRA